MKLGTIKKIAIGIILFMAYAALAYVTMAFVKSEPDPALWSEFERVGVIVLMVVYAIVSVLAYVAYSQFNDNQ